MKRLFLLPVMLLCCMAASAQNLQLHYDFGKHIYDEESGRQSLTATFEQFKADKLGSWFYFIDLDFNNKGMAGAYTEISREFNVYKPCKQGALAAHVEYNGGLNRKMSYYNNGLFGAAWNGHSEDFSKTYSLQVMYKQFFGNKEENHGGAYASFQITGVWGLNFFDNKFTFSGFADLWREKAAGDGYMVFLTEPQLWYNITDKFSAGTEIEMSYNFPYQNEKFFVNPTLAVKYNF